MDIIQEHINYVRQVMTGKLTHAEAESELDRLERTYGEAAFIPGTVSRKEKPWTMQDLHDLERDAIAGAGSREFLSYIAEVGEYVHRRLRIKKIITIIGGIAAVLAIIAGIINLLNRT